MYYCPHGVLPLLWYLSLPPHGDDDVVELPKEALVLVEEELDQLRQEYVRSHRLPVGHPQNSLLHLEEGRLVVERPSGGPLLESIRHLGVERWRLGVEERAEPSGPSFKGERGIS